jgi:site-specific DNA-methyltransferase (adenine-specific)
MTVDILHGDCMDVLPYLASNSFDSCVTDPPYNLESIRKRFGGDGAAPARAKQSGVYARQSKGFMGKTWDSDIAFQKEMWTEVYRVLKPGAHVLAFGGSRTYHRLACAVEDAGFEIRDQIMWLYGSGFPKSHNLDGDWSGWGTALKPAHEPIVMARKPLAGTVAANVARWGVGAINIDGCRVEGEPWAAHRATGLAKTKFFTDGEAVVIDKTPHDLGRFPANVIHDGSADVLSAFPNAPGQQRYVGPEHGSKASVNVYGDMGARPPTPPRGDSGSAARFFYCAKASKTDRGPDNTHPTVKPTELMRYLCRLVTPPGGKVLDPFLGSGSTGRGAVIEGFAFTGIEMTDEYVPIAKARIAAVQPQVGVFA